MSNAFILQQSAAFGPGILTGILRDFGIPVQVRKLYAGDELPTDLDELRFLVVLGGPQRVADVGSDQSPFLAKEVELLKRLIAVDRPVLGIGLGAQLLAHAAGAKVYPNARPGKTPADPMDPAPEFGWHPVMFPFPGGTEPMVLGIVDGSPMFHWHVDTFDLPRLPPPPGLPPNVPPAPTGSALLSSSKLCKNQVFRFKNRLFGFQFHFELTAPDIDAIVSAGRDELAKLFGPDAEKQIRYDTEKNLHRYNRLGERIVRNFVQFTKTY
ncbi:MAG TPA: type 1 glutamine amidotransferase [Tepidisphaeraceae bacterium]|nr:type 1 glutamine amidotransferase [Tepidisphaeraceae bacterium]